MDIINTHTNPKKTIEHVLYIDSRYAYSDPVSNVDFSVLFNYANDSRSSSTPQVFKNVVSVELTGVSFPADHVNHTNEHGIILDIQELNDRLCSNIPHANQSFAVLYTPKSASQTTTLVKGMDFEGPKIKRFNPPMSSLNRLTIKMLHPFENKVIEDYGHTTMIFKITTEQYMA